MNPFVVSVQRFNEFAEEFAQKFMNIDSYKDSIEKFCTIENNMPEEILELGCGPGNVTRFIQEKFPGTHILAIDLAPNMIEMARRLVPDVQFEIMDVRDIGNLSEKFDLIMCSFCLPFLSKKDAFTLIRNCSELLHEKGKLYISTMEGAEGDEGFEPTSFTGEAEIYFQYYQENDLLEMFKNAGFQVGYYKRQPYTEPDGSITNDLIFIGVKDKSK